MQFLVAQQQNDKISLQGIIILLGLWLKGSPNQAKVASNSKHFSVNVQQIGDDITYFFKGIHDVTKIIIKYLFLLLVNDIIVLPS